MLRGVVEQFHFRVEGGSVGTSQNPYRRDKVASLDLLFTNNSIAIFCHLIQKPS